MKDLQIVKEDLFGKVLDNFLKIQAPLFSLEIFSLIWQLKQKCNWTIVKTC